MNETRSLRLHIRPPERRVLRRPDHHASRVRQFLRRAEVVVLIEIILAALFQEERVGRPGGIWAAVPLSAPVRAERAAVRGEPQIPSLRHSANLPEG